MRPSVKGDWANRSGLGDFERSMRLLVGRGGTRGVEVAAKRSLAGLLDGRGGMTGCCIVGAVIVCESFKDVDADADAKRIVQLLYFFYAMSM